jgi:hypothetical protein
VEGEGRGGDTSHQEKSLGRSGLNYHCQGEGGDWNSLFPSEFPHQETYVNWRKDILCSSGL